MIQHDESPLILLDVHQPPGIRIILLEVLCEVAYESRMIDCRELQKVYVLVFFSLLERNDMECFLSFYFDRQSSFC